MVRPRIEGVYELGHILYALDADTHGFARGDIEHVECFWCLGDMHSSSAGFVFRLHDGRRAYVDFLHTHAFEQIEDFRIEVELLPEGKRPAGDWSFETAHLDRVLARST